MLLNLEKIFVSSGRGPPPKVIIKKVIIVMGSCNMLGAYASH